MQKKESHMLGEILAKIAPKIGAKVLLEPVWGVTGQIIFKNDKHSYFRYNTLDLNPVGSADIAKDKDYADFFMKSMDYSTVPRSKAFFSERWAKAIKQPTQNIDAAYEYARTIGMPVIVKPNSGSQGVGVCLVATKKEFYTAVKSITAHDRVFLVQKPLQGKDYRIVVLDDTVISAYERIPLNVTGTGKHTITQLIRKKQKEFTATGRDTTIKAGDPRIALKLAHQKLQFDSVPAKDQQVFLLDNANLSSGGDSIDVTKEIHPDFAKLAVKLTHDMGLRLCGVDLIVRGTIEERPAEYWILEINAAPGLDHYAKIGTAQKKIVEDLYLQVLKHLE